MEIAICQMDESSLGQVYQVDGAFTVAERLRVQARAGVLSYTVESVPPFIKRYPAEALDLASFIGNPDKVIYLAYVDENLAGQIILWENWNGYGYINDIAVDARYRRLGIGRQLIARAVEWARARGLPGLMLETQDINVAACRFYASCGFRLGGFDQYLYRGLHPEMDEVALYWYLIF
jgi:ribosomal protein S18 acetylase RimI-like enzyme